jgi:HAMP domain-containing protein
VVTVDSDVIARVPRVTHPAERVAWMIETAKAVIDGRVDVAEAARAADVQFEQLADLLRSDRNAVPQRESDAVATRLRLYAEQVSDLAASSPERATEHEALAGALGRLAQVLR